MRGRFRDVRLRVPFDDGFLHYKRVFRSMASVVLPILDAGSSVKFRNL